MNKETAKQLKEAGFPDITRVAAENNLRRYITMDWEGLSYPFLQELIAEVETDNFFLAKTKNTITEDDNGNKIQNSKENPWKSKPIWVAGFIGGGYGCGVSVYDGKITNYIDDGVMGKIGETPEDAVAKLWLSIQPPK